MSRIEHPLRNLNEHCMQGRFGEFAEIRHIGVSPTRLARQNSKVIPGMVWITESLGLECDIVGFL
jgi:hypothetical protein